MSASSDETIRIWDFNTGDCNAILKGHNDCLLSITTLFDDNIIASVLHQFIYSKNIY